MNGKATFGLFLTVSVLLMGILLGGSPRVFWDATSGFLVVGVTAGLLVVTHGLPATLKSLFGGLGRLIMPSRFEPWMPEESKAAANIASSAIRFSLLSAVLGGLISFVAMLQNLTDPSQIGPAMAVMMLTAFYALSLIALWFLPIARRFS